MLKMSDVPDDRDKEYLSKICSKTEKKVSVTEIGPWFQFPIPNSGFSCTLTLEYQMVSAPVIAFKHI